jgi:ferredoxin
MTYIVTEACIRCQYMECVEVCPQQAFHAGANFVVIDPERCANCGLCEMVCPVGAIYSREMLPDHHAHYAALNAELARTWPVIAAKAAVPADADAWARVEEKMHLLVRAPAPVSE